MLNNQSVSASIVIIGAGLCGMMMALYLARRGYSIEIYEKDDASTLDKIPEKRATELDLSIRGILALSEINLVEQVLAKSVPTEKRVLFYADQTELKIQHGYEQKHIIYNIARHDLYHVLLSATRQEKNITIHFSHQLISVDSKQHLLIFRKRDENQFVIKKYCYVLGCDGVNSILRHYLNNQYSDNKNGSYVYKEMTLPSSFTTQYLSIKSTYKWIGDKSAFLAHPKMNHCFSATLVLPGYLEHDYANVFTNSNFPQLKSIIHHLSNEFMQQSFYKLKSTKVRCQQQDGILLLGDAAHGMLPFLGQGVNCAFEDCRLFNRYLDDSEDNWEEAMKHFIRDRKKDTDAIIDMSEIEYQEFELECPLIKHQFIEKIKIELSDRYPHLFKSHRYLLAFTHVPYSIIKQHYQRQKQILNKLYHHFKVIKRIRWDVVDSLIKNYDTQQIMYKQG
jgi:kynurenine 3-monooxygenase